MPFSLPDPFLMTYINTAAFEGDEKLLRFYLDHIDQLDTGYDANKGPPRSVVIDAYASAAAGNQLTCAQMILDCYDTRHDNPPNSLGWKLLQKVTNPDMLDEMVNRVVVQRSDVSFAQLLLDRYPDNIKLNKVLHDSIFQGTQDVIEFFIERGGDVNYGGGELVMRAVFVKRHDLAMWLVKQMDVEQFGPRMINELFFNHSQAQDDLWLHLYDRDLIQQMLDDKGGSGIHLKNPEFRAYHERQMLENNIDPAHGGVTRVMRKL